LAVASREASARGQVATGTREPRNHRVLTRETSSCHRPLEIYMHIAARAGSAGRRWGERVGAPSTSVSLVRPRMSDTRSADRCVRLVRNLNIATATASSSGLDLGLRVTPCARVNGGAGGCPVTAWRGGAGEPGVPRREAPPGGSRVRSLNARTTNETKFRAKVTHCRE